MSFIRRIKKSSGVYLAEVESYREDGKVKQRVLKYIGKETAIQQAPSSQDSPSFADIRVSAVKQYLDYRVLHELACQIGLPSLLGKKFKPILLLVYTQILTRKSLYALPEYLQHTAIQDILGVDKIVDKHLYQALDELEALDFIPVETAIATQFSSLVPEKQALVIDVTDTYFSGSQADWKRRRGKQGRYDKLIQIALAVTSENGFPLTHRIYEGNINHVKIFQDLLGDPRLKAFDTIILDRGMPSAQTIELLKRMGQKVLTGLRAYSSLKKEFLDKVDREEIYQPKNRVVLKDTEVFVQTFPYQQGELIVLYNPVLEAEKRNQAMNTATYSPENAKYMGYSLLYHDTTMTPEDVVKAYFDKDVVEKAYRELKTSIKLNPIRKYRLDHVKAHVKICYLAYALLSLMKYRLKPLKLSATKALEKLQPIHKVTLTNKSGTESWTQLVTLTNEQNQILAALNCSV